MLSLIGCTADEIQDPTNQTEANETEEDINYTPIVEVNQFLESDQLRERLLEATAIELKDTENNTIGMIQEREKIINLVDSFFTYTIKEELETNQSSEIIGPINFYFTNSEDIYGLMNNEFIYLEGYYFVINNRIARELENYFRANIATAPVGEQ